MSLVERLLRALGRRSGEERAEAERVLLEADFGVARPLPSSTGWRGWASVTLPARSSGRSPRRSFHRLARRRPAPSRARAFLRR